MKRIALRKMRSCNIKKTALNAWSKTTTTTQERSPPLGLWSSSSSQLTLTLEITRSSTTLSHKSATRQEMEISTSSASHFVSKRTSSWRWWMTIRRLESSTWRGPGKEESSLEEGWRSFTTPLRSLRWKQLTRDLSDRGMTPFMRTHMTLMRMTQSLKTLRKTEKQRRRLCS